MEKLSILQKKLYIQGLFQVIRSGSSNPNRRMYHENRYSDAFVYILSGSCVYTFADGSSFTVNQGDILYLAEHASYSMHIQTPEYYFIFCDFSFDCQESRKSAVYTPENSSHAENLFLKLLHQHQSVKENAFTDCMVLLYKIYGTIVKSGMVGYMEKAAERRIRAAKEWIDAKYSDNGLSVASLAEQAEMSEVYFRRLFKEKYQLSPSQYIIAVRVKHAKKLLRHPFITVEECAEQCGFSSAQYFCRVLKAETGLTPTRFRNIK